MGALDGHRLDAEGGKGLDFHVHDIGRGRRHRERAPRPLDGWATVAPVTSRPYVIMGVVNVTPDSFSDGGAFEDAVAAVAHAGRLVAEGAGIVDVGGESTRPGADPVPVDEELRRVVPVVEGVVAARLNAQVSIDTMKLAVAEAAVDAGASYVNDVTAFRHEPELAGLVADRGLDCCLMHMLGEPRTMQRDPHYDDVVDDVKAFLEERMAAATAAGIPEERIQLDPGIGFGKTLEHNLELLRRLGELVALGRPIVVGTSRKTFLGRITGRDVTERVHATVATSVMAFERGARVFRVHDVAATADALAVAAATLAAGWPGTPTTTTSTTTRTPTTRTTTRAPR
jgi:dihydropteroate synthase